MTTVIVDTGPLIALFDRRSEHHTWVLEQLNKLSAPLLTCDAVLSESIFLLQRDGLQPGWLIEYMRKGAVKTGFDLNRNLDFIQSFFRRFSDRKLSLADACLVRMSEIYRESIVFTLDRDLLFYRRNGRQKIPLLAPFA